jgi:hypothetical protein
MTSYQHDGAGPLSRRLVLGLLGSIPAAAGAAVATGGSAQASTAGCGQPPVPPPKALQQRIPSQLNMTGYGPDIRIVSDRVVFGHTGGAAGETTDIDIYPDLDWVAVILSNYDISNQVASLIELQDQLIT